MIYNRPCLKKIATSKMLKSECETALKLCILCVFAVQLLKLNPIPPYNHLAYNCLITHPAERIPFGLFTRTGSTFPLSLFNSQMLLDASLLLFHSRTLYGDLHPEACHRRSYQSSLAENSCWTAAGYQVDERVESEHKR